MNLDAVGWAKQSVPTMERRNRKDGGHGAKGAFAHPTTPETTIMENLAK